MRDINVVIDFLLREVIPKKPSYGIRERLKTIRKNAAYHPPEMQQDDWCNLVTDLTIYLSR